MKRALLVAILSLSAGSTAAATDTPAGRLLLPAAVQSSMPDQRASVPFRVSSTRRTVAARTIATNPPRLQWSRREGPLPDGNVEFCAGAYE